MMSFVYRYTNEYHSSDIMGLGLHASFDSRIVIPSISHWHLAKKEPVPTTPNYFQITLVQENCRLAMKTTSIFALTWPKLYQFVVRMRRS